MKKNIVITISAVATLLAACQPPVVLEKSQITSLTDDNLCELYTSKRRLEPNTWATVSSTVNNRKLDCSPAHRKCTSFGYRKGSKDYGKCRMEIERMASSERQTQHKLQSEQKQIDSLMQGLQKMQDDQQMHDIMSQPRY